MNHTKEDLKALQNKTLEEKIQISTARINEDGVWQPGNGGLGMGHVLDYIGVNYEPIKTEE